MGCGQFPQCLFLSCLLASAQPNKHILFSCIGLNANHIHKAGTSKKGWHMLLLLRRLMHVDTELT